LGEARDLFREQIKNSLKFWIEAIAEVLVEAGIEPQIAREQSEDAIASIQGALILARGLDDLEPFQRTLRQIKNLTLVI
jgi:TetR/AcrR family transcriptional regulator, lmrAB and yxaGH operons repressor